MKTPPSEEFETREIFHTDGSRSTIAVKVPKYYVTVKGKNRDNFKLYSDSSEGLLWLVRAGGHEILEGPNFVQPPSLPRVMTPCIIESPFKGKNKAEESRNRAYLDKCIRWCVLHGYTPYASHKMLTDSLDDSNHAERTSGIVAGLTLSVLLLRYHAAPAAPVFFFLDYGESEGMKHAREKYRIEGMSDRILEQKIGTL
jgi:hypothetical protein